MGKWDISQSSLPNISELCIHISRGKWRIGKNTRDHVLSRVNKSAAGILSRAKIRNLLDQFKTYILGNLSEQIDTLKLQNK